MLSHQMTVQLGLNLTSKSRNTLFKPYLLDHLDLQLSASGGCMTPSCELFIYTHMNLSEEFQMLRKHKKPPGHLAGDSSLILWVHFFSQCIIYKQEAFPPLNRTIIYCLSLSDITVWHMPDLTTPVYIWVTNHRYCQINQSLFRGCAQFPRQTTHFNFCRLISCFKSI